MRKHAWMMACAIILITTVSGCTEIELRQAPVELPKPARPVLPAVAAEDVACLTDDAYARIVERDRLRGNYAEECIAIIDANNQGARDAR